MVQRYPQNKNKGKNKHVSNKPIKTTTFKKKKLNKADLECYICGKLKHFSMECLERADHRGKIGFKNVNMVTASNTNGYGNLSIIFLVFQSSSCWIDSGC